MDLATISFVVTALATGWSICWSIFTHCKKGSVDSRRTSEPQAKPDNPVLIAKVSMADIKKFDPKVDAVINAAEREDAREPNILAMVNTSDTAFRGLVYTSAVVWGLLLLLRSLVTMSERTFNIISIIVTAIPTIGLGMIVVGCVMSGILTFSTVACASLFKRLRAYYRERRFGAFIGVLTASPLWMVRAVLLAILAFLESLVLTFCFVSEERQRERQNVWLALIDRELAPHGIGAFFELDDKQTQPTS